MTAPRDVKAVQQAFAWLEGGRITRQEAIDRLGFTLSGDEIDGVLEVIAPEHHPLITAGHREALQRRADEDCLQPEWSPFDLLSQSYHQRLAGLLLNTSSDERLVTRFSVVCLPSHQTEWSIRLLWSWRPRLPISTPRLVLLRADQSIWAAGGKSVEVSHDEVEIAEPFANRLERLWEKMLLSTRASRHVGTGLDGVTYHFAHRQRAGQTWSPRPHTRAGQFVEVAHTLARFTTAGDAEGPRIEAELNDHLGWFGV